SIYLSFVPSSHLCIFFFTCSATSVFYTLSLHDALPILLVKTLNSAMMSEFRRQPPALLLPTSITDVPSTAIAFWSVRNPLALLRSEEHTSELQSRVDLVCRLLLEKKNNTTNRRDRRTCT